MLDDLKNQRDALGEIIYEHYRLLTPIRRMPDDILSEIFLWCLPDKHNAVMSASEAPLLLGRVCSRWRYVAYRTPRLWATLHIPLPIPPSPNILLSNQSLQFQQVSEAFEEKYQNHCQAIREWFARSGSRPLSISFNPKESFPSTTSNEQIRKYFDLILEYSHRWRDLEISITAAEFSTFLASISSNAVPLLESLHLKFFRRNMQPDAWQCSGLLNAPKLRVLQVSQFPCRPSTLNVDWSRLTHLIIADSGATLRNRNLNLTEAQRIFVQCKHLVHCSIDIMDVPDATCDSSEPISLPHLVSLDVVDGAKGLSTLFRNLYVPALRSISYHTTLWPTTRTQQSPLFVLLSGTNGQITSFSTDIHLFTYQEVLEIFNSMPLLKSFSNRRSRFGHSREQSRMRGCPIYKDVMKAVLDLLSPSPDGRSCLCPRLLNIDLSDSLYLKEEDALHFLRARLGASDIQMSVGCSSFETMDVARLTSVSITFTLERANYLDIQKALEPYVREGLKLNLSFPHPRKISPGIINPLSGLPKYQASDILWSF